MSFTSGMNLLGSFQSSENGLPSLLICEPTGIANLCMPSRVVASTYFVDAADGLVVDGHHLTGPLALVVIGDPQTMRTALNIPGGVVDTVHQHGGNVIVQESTVAKVSAVRPAGSLKYAHPMS